MTDTGRGRGRDCDLVAAIAGAPNVGKTSLFNVLTGRAEKVANWPGVTVELKTAVVRLNSLRVCLVDLPGTYGLSGVSGEEEVARDFIIFEKPDVIVALADATNLERTLYLPIEVLEYTGRVVLALTKIDAAMEKGIRIDVDGLSSALGVPVVATSSLKRIGIDALEEAILEASKRPGRRLHIDYGKLEPYVRRIEKLLADAGVEPGLARWLAVRLLEGLEWAKHLVVKLLGERGREIVRVAEDARREYREATGHDPAEDAVKARFAFIEKLVHRYVEASKAKTVELTKLDSLILHPILGPVTATLILLAVFFAVFTVNLGFPLNIILDQLGLHDAAALVEEYSLGGLLGLLFNHLAEVVREHVTPEWFASLLADGIIGGVGLVLSFVPLIATVYAVFAALEDSGIAPRMAVAYDPLLRVFRLTGKAIFPAIMGLGCNVPAVMATRILEARKERRVVAVAVPMIPCQARLVVILAFVAAFFAKLGALIAAVTALSMYITGFAAFALTAYVFARLTGYMPSGEYLIELPPYKYPSAKVVWWHVKHSVTHFLVRAGTVILALSVITWLITSFTPSLTPASTPEDSIAAALGRILAPAVQLVFGVSPDVAWRLGFAFIQGLVAKEVFLDALAMTAPGGVEVAPEQAVAYLGLTPAQAYAVLLAVTLYMPCLATLATIYSETRSLKLTLAALAFSLVLATVAALAARLILELFL